jgi:hypothetical protein
MNTNEMIRDLDKLGIQDSDMSLDNSKSFLDIKNSVIKAIDIIDNALPKMKTAGIDMKKAAFDAEGLFRNIIHKGWGEIEVEFYVIHNGHKAITAIGPRHLDSIVEQIKSYITNY